VGRATLFFQSAVANYIVTGVYVVHGDFYELQLVVGQGENFARD
jgi:hypothetical protein